MKKFTAKIQEQFALMCATGKLFRAKITGDEVYTMYLLAFPDGANPIFRDPASSTHNCNNCKNFIRRYGNIVAIDAKGQTMTIFDLAAGSVSEAPYNAVANEVATLIASKDIENVFFESYDMLDQKLNYEKCNKKQDSFRLGIAENHKQYTKEEADKFGVVSPGELRRFDHMHMNVPKQFVNVTKDSVEAIMGTYRDKYQVFKRAMEEISLDTLNLVEDLINQGSLLDGTAHLGAVKVAIAQKKEYMKTAVCNQDNLAWVASYGMDERHAKFRNTLIGVLCTELTQGEDLNKAVENWNKRVDPANYMKAVAPITKKQIEEARKFVEENGYTDSFDRRLAILDDIKVDEIKYSDAGKGKIPEVNIFDTVKPTATQHKRAKFDDVEEVSIEKFMEDILPKCSSIEALLLNAHQGNLVTMTTSNNKESKPIFKWSNNYSWDFNGNLAGKSQIREAVSAKGGRVDGAFRFSHSWNNVGRNESLMDLHVFMPGCTFPTDKNTHDSYPGGRRVGWNHRQDTMSGGIQDVDYVNQAPVGYIPVENITFPDLKKMPDGLYVCRIHNWHLRGTTNSGGTAEIEFDGNLYEYDYPRLGNKEWLTVAEVTLKNGVFTIEHKLPCKAETSRELWGLQTNEFHKVNLVCLSPNHWGSSAVGNKHYFFMLEGCKTDKPVRGFHNENLLPDLLAHRKVMEVLGSTNTIKVDPKDKQLSGLGFNSTVKSEVVLKLSGSFKRMIKVKF